MSYDEIKDATCKLLRRRYSTIELLFRNEEQNTLLIITHSMNKTELVKELSQSELFRLRNSINKEWKFNVINDINVFTIFKKSKQCKMNLNS